MQKREKWWKKRRWTPNGWTDERRFSFESNFIIISLFRPPPSPLSTFPGIPNNVHTKLNQIEWKGAHILATINNHTSQTVCCLEVKCRPLPFPAVVPEEGMLEHHVFGSRRWPVKSHGEIFSSLIPRKNKTWKNDDDDSHRHGKGNKMRPTTSASFLTSVPLSILRFFLPLFPMICHSKIFIWRIFSRLVYLLLFLKFLFKSSRVEPVVNLVSCGGEVKRGEDGKSRGQGWATGGADRRGRRHESRSFSIFRCTAM